MFAASLLAVAVLAAYAGLAMLSLGVSSPLSVAVNSVNGAVGNFIWHQPSLNDVASVHRSTPSGIVQGGVLADQIPIDFGPLTGSTPATHSLDIQNTSGKTLPLVVSVANAQGVVATFAGGGTQFNLPPKQHATVEVSSDPMHAGPISGTVELSVLNSSIKPITVELTGAQAPIAPGAVTATPAAGGAVDLAWTPSPSTGVAGYVVQRSAAGTGAWQSVGGLTASTTAVDSTGTDGQTFSYRVLAEAAGVTPTLLSTAGGTGSAVTDASAPAQPTGFGDLPPYLNAQTADNALAVSVNLPQASSASDTISVTLHDSAGGTPVTETRPGGGASAQFTFSGIDALPDGNLTFTATATDSIGNAGAPVSSDPITLDTQAPDSPTSVTVPDLITQQNDQSVPLDVVSTDSAPNDTLHISVLSSDGTTTPLFNGPVAGFDGTTADMSSLPQGDATVSASITDQYGNRSAPAAQATTSIDTVGPDLPTDLDVAAGPHNPAGVVTSASQSAVTIEATFAQAPDPADTITIWVAGTAYPIQADGQSTTITLGPLDLSGLQDGTWGLGIKMIDASGNASKHWTHFVKDTSGPENPTSVGVPAGPSNPAGYVNAATQTAATIVAAFASPTSSTDQIALSVGGLDLGTQQGGGDTASWTGDLSSLPDGTLQILGTITDAAGNSTDFSGTLIKDTQPPPAPAFAQVVGPPPNTIDPATASCVKVAVMFNQAPDPSDMVTVTLSDENTSVEGSAPAGNGQVTVGCIDASSLSAGHIAVNVTVTDAAGNSTSTAGTTAIKLNCQHS